MPGSDMRHPKENPPGRGPWRRLFWPLLLIVAIFFASGRGEIAAPGIGGIDKVGHFLVFGLLATLILRVGFRADRPWRSFLLTVALTSLYGAADEFRQSFTPGRAVEVGDWVADTAGGLLAAALYAFCGPWRRLLESGPRRAAPAPVREREVVAGPGIDER